MGKPNLRHLWLIAAIENHNSDECLLWPFQKDKDGYGRLRPIPEEIGKRITYGAHRLAFKIANGRWPVPNALHTCDNPPCINPRHLFEGTDQDNHDDQVAKGRQVKGTQQSQAKLTEEIVLQARKEYLETDLGFYRLARKYGVSTPAIKTAIEGVNNWKHVPNPVGSLRPPKRRKKDKCSRGHDLSEGNIYIYGRVRQCKLCTQLRAKGRNRCGASEGAPA